MYIDLNIRNIQFEVSKNFIYGVSNNYYLIEITDIQPVPEKLLLEADTSLG